MEIKKYEGRPQDGISRSAEELAVYDLLDNLGINYQTVCHAPAYTMEECEVVERELGAPICKNLFLCNRQQTDYYLLLIPGDKIFKTKYSEKSFLSLFFTFFLRGLFFLFILLHIIFCYKPVY